MSDPRTAQGVTKMFPGTGGGHARPAQPQRAPAPKPVRWVAPLPPIILSNTSTPFDYCKPAGLNPPAEFDDLIRTARASYGHIYEGPGVTHDEPLGGSGADPQDPATYFLADAIHYYIPGATDIRVEINFWFSEETGSGPTATCIRGLRIRLNRDSDFADVANEYRTYSGTRLGPIRARLVIGPYDIPEPFTIYTYCNWGDVMGTYPQHPLNALPETGAPLWAILVTGHLI